MGKDSLQKVETIRLCKECIAKEKMHGKGEWGFKSLKRLTKIAFSHKDYAQVKNYFSELLTYMNNSVNRADADKALTKLFDLFATERENPLYTETLDLALQKFKETNNERLRSKTSIRLATAHFEAGEYDKAKQLALDLQKACLSDGTAEDVSKSSQLLEYTSLLVQIYWKLQDIREVDQQLRIADSQKNAMAIPRAWAPIREIKGRLNLQRRKFEDAQSDLFDAFKYYAQLNSPKAVVCLRYAILAGMLNASSVNPVSSSEARPYLTDPTITILAQMVEASQSHDMDMFNNILSQKDKMNTIQEDEIISRYLNEITRSMRRNMIKRLVTPYTSIRLEAIAQEINCDIKEVENLCATLITDGLVNGKINQVTGMLLLEGKQERQEKFNAIKGWTEALRDLHQSLM